MTIQELNQLVGIKLLTSDFLECLVLSSNFHGGECPFPLPPCGNPWTWTTSVKSGAKK